MLFILAFLVFLVCVSVGESYPSFVYFLDNFKGFFLSIVNHLYFLFLLSIQFLVFSLIPFIFFSFALVHFFPCFFLVHIFYQYEIFILKYAHFYVLIFQLSTTLDRYYSFLYVQCLMYFSTKTVVNFCLDFVFISQIIQKTVFEVLPTQTV